MTEGTISNPLDRLQPSPPNPELADPSPALWDASYLQGPLGLPVDASPAAQPEVTAQDDGLAVLQQVLQSAQQGMSQEGFATLLQQLQDDLTSGQESDLATLLARLPEKLVAAGVSTEDVSAFRTIISADEGMQPAGVDPLWQNPGLIGDPAQPVQQPALSILPGYDLPDGGIPAGGAAQELGEGLFPAQPSTPFNLDLGQTSTGDPLLQLGSEVPLSPSPGLYPAAPGLALEQPGQPEPLGPLGDAGQPPPGGEAGNELNPNERLLQQILINARQGMSTEGFAAFIQQVERDILANPEETNVQALLQRVQQQLQPVLSSQDASALQSAVQAVQTPQAEPQDLTQVAPTTFNNVPPPVAPTPAVPTPETPTPWRLATDPDGSLPPG